MTDSNNVPDEVAEESEAKRVTITRSIRLSSDVVERLAVLCDHLGVTPGAYMTAAVGKALSQDEMTFHVGQHTANSQTVLQEHTAKSQDMMAEFMATLAAALQAPKE